MRFPHPPAVTRPTLRARRAAVRASTLGVALLAVLVAVLAGCARRRHPEAAGTAAARDAALEPVGPIAVLVENRGVVDVVVYAVRGSVRQRLGNVPGTTRMALQVPAAFTLERMPFALFVAQLAGSETYASESVAPMPGMQLQLTVQPRLVTSSLIVQ